MQAKRRSHRAPLLERGTDLCAVLPSSAQGLNEKSPITGHYRTADDAYRVHLQNINLHATRGKREKIPFEMRGISKAAPSFFGGNRNGL
ncbi:hypothetical protein AGR7C_Lc60061 [Agrobacterium deltaense Zutra 3/1]|uniref:Uncharacterized protein n=1 Tax=Agrobacterium deltaense Zutra 3/1 TaxID=1183427 RepID=A0A1S7RXA1_9HYPH|nr:hypothetical protein AGR7C_Lc60061 [Agrobacterium deltaense Zutra 3/1]